MAIDLGNQNSFLKLVFLFYNLTPLNILEFQKNDKKIFENKFEIKNQKSFNKILQISKIHRNLRKFMKFDPKKGEFLRLEHLTDYLSSESAYRSYSRIEIWDLQVKENVETLLNSGANKLSGLYIGAFTNLINQKFVNESIRFAILKSNATVLTSGVLLAQKKDVNNKKAINENKS